VSLNKSLADELNQPTSFLTAHSIKQKSVKPPKMHWVGLFKRKGLVSSLCAFAALPFHVSALKLWMFDWSHCCIQNHKFAGRTELLKTCNVHSSCFGSVSQTWAFVMLRPEDVHLCHTVTPKQVMAA